MFRTSLFAFLVCVATSSTATGEVLPPPQKIAPHSYVWIGPYGPPNKENQGFRMNLGFVAGNDAVAVIDSGYGDAMAKSMLKQIQNLSGKPVRYVINTNSQPHRILGNAVFSHNGAAVIAGAQAEARIVNEGAAMAAVAAGILGQPANGISPPGKPDRTLREAAQLDLGGVTIKILPVGNAHTPGSLIVEVVEDNVVFAGDVLYGGRLLAILPVSRVDGWIRAYERLGDFSDALFVPGHGAPAKLGEFDLPTLQYLTALKNHMDAAVASGLDLQDAIRGLDQSAWKNLADFDSMAGRNAHQCYLEREAAAFEYGFSAPMRLIFFKAE